MKPTNIYNFTIPANGVYRLFVAGEYFKILASTGFVEVQADFGRLGPIKAGQGLEKTPFPFLLFADKSGAQNTLQVVIGDENFIDAASGDVSVVKNKAAQSGSFVSAGATVGVASAQLLPANAGRQYLAIQNRHGTEVVYVQFGAAATVANGLAIVPGGALELAGPVPTQAIHCIGSAAAIPVVVVEASA